MPSGVYVRDPAKIASRTVSEPFEESRQHYANVRVSDWQTFRARSGAKVTFPELLQVFRISGTLYDQGARLADREPLGWVA